MPNGIYTPGQSNAYVDRSTNQRMPNFVQRPGYPGSLSSFGGQRRGMSNLYSYPETRYIPRVPSRRLKGRLLIDPVTKRRSGMRNRLRSDTMSSRQLNRYK